MHVLLHGNQCPARGGGISPQLLGRLDKLIKRAQSGPIDHVYFFAKDTYPNGITAADFVREQLVKAGFSLEQLTIAPTAGNTRREVEEFVRRRAGRNHRGPVGAVTSFYHARRCEFLLREAGCRPEMIKSMNFGLGDLLLEPVKLILECSGPGRQIKRYFKSRGHSRLAT